MAVSPLTGPRIGVVVLTFRAADVIAECLASLFASTGVALSVVVVDNNSPDGSLDAARNWASGAVPFVRPSASPLAGIPPASVPIPFEERAATDFSAPRQPLTLVQSGINGGFARGINHGLRILQADPGIDLFWILNPDAAPPPEAAARLADCAAQGPFGLIASRLRFYEEPGTIQNDGLRLDRRFGVCHSVSMGQPASTPYPANGEVEFPSGASMLASRAMLEQAGLMCEDYFLYYEEAEWGARTGSLPVRFASGAEVFHHGGTSIGTGSIHRPPSPLAAYFNYRNRARFVSKYLPGSLLRMRLHACAKVVQMLLKGYLPQAQAILAGTFDLAPPAAVRRIFPDSAVQALAFGTRP